MLFLGYDIGSSSIKGALLDAETGRPVASAQSPEAELEIAAPRPGWAEQDPEVWWEHLKRVTHKLRQSSDLGSVKAIGIAYQMHGLVLVDRELRVLRPAIIWCDSRAVKIGQAAFQDLGPQKCLARFLNSPGNFTASKLRWVKENEPDVFAATSRFLLPGDYIAMRLTGEAATTPSGLSEAILWDFIDGAPASDLLDFFEIPHSMMPPVRPTFAEQGGVGRPAAEELGVAPGTPVTYRAGDQPNNAFSLGALEPGELAATAGTSGVVYGVTDKPVFDPLSRVNTFVHVNHQPDSPRNGTLLCVNGTGSLNRWLRQNFSSAAHPLTYVEMNQLAEGVAVGSEGLLFFPFGNGAERTLENYDLGAGLAGLQFNRHGRGHLFRAAQEGIVFALHYGVKIMRSMGVKVERVRAGASNMFLSPVFGQTFANVTGALVELYETDGAEGAARGAGLGSGAFRNAAESLSGLKRIRTIEPDAAASDACRKTYETWEDHLRHRLAKERRHVRPNQLS